jgi:hypothetical protein
MLSSIRIRIVGGPDLDFRHARRTLVYMQMLGSCVVPFFEFFEHERQDSLGSLRITKISMSVNHGVGTGTIMANLALSCSIALDHGAQFTDNTFSFTAR